MNHYQIHCHKCGMLTVTHTPQDKTNYCPICGNKIPKPDQSNKPKISNKKINLFQWVNKKLKFIIIAIVSVCLIIGIAILDHYFDYDPAFFESIKEHWSKSDNNTSTVIEATVIQASSESKNNTFNTHEENKNLPTSPITTPPQPPQQEKIAVWKYKKEYDSFDSTTSEYCYTYSSNMHERLLIRKLNKKTEVLLSSNYLFRSNLGDNFRVRLKFDDSKPYSNGYNDSNSLDQETIFLRHPQKIINLIKDSESLVIEYPSITNGNLRALFSLHDYNSVCKF